MKDSSHIKFEKHKFTLSGIRPPLIITIILGTVMGIAFIIPVILFLFVALTDLDFQFGMLISTTIAWAVGYYLFRLVSWNLNGYETFEFMTDKIYFTAGTKYLILRKDELNNVSINVTVKPIDDTIFYNGKSDYIAFLEISNNEEILTSTLRIPQSQLDYLKDYLIDHFQF